MKRMMLILSLTLISICLFTSLSFAQEEKKVKPVEFKIKGKLFAHPEQNDIKIMTDDFQTFIMPLNKGARIDLTTKGKFEEMAKEREVPNGEVTFTLIDGKPVVTRISYTSEETWKIELPKK
jgi:hypothetical protein